MITNIDAERLEHFLHAYGHNAHTHLYFMGDKQFFWEAEGFALIVYRKAGNRRIVLGDPIGEAEAVLRVIDQFIRKCRSERSVPVFYQVKAAGLALYERYGLQSVKLGEEAQINLPSFHTAGKAWLKLRTRLNKFERNGHRFEVIQPPFSTELLQELADISDEWLGKRKEKSFSVGAFSLDYANRFPVSLLRSPDGRIDAFASLGGDHVSEPGRNPDALPRRLTVDLMRHRAGSAHGTMDVLFLLLFAWGKEQGYEVCSLGMAPLAGACESKLARLIYKYGNKLYNFKGLYEYKNKFAPVWEDVYLVAPAASMPITVLQLALVINGFGQGKAAARSKSLRDLLPRVSKDATTNCPLVQLTESQHVHD
ncbi:phosphatidylglycerol lysyltransferase [Paenibacillus phyllosphaerae]|uniref:Phosphatidylglycerol lysyltransferase n=1 Tax=Paenibacillus phyllosphaerae TaxID=274593 RepID=A0A7W5AWS8_9BACL|nr:phosphatidylglycerol lysyltransferase [Paenibacillus phyllosphaerae]